MGFVTCFGRPSGMIRLVHLLNTNNMVRKNGEFVPKVGVCWKESFLGKLEKK